MDRVYFAARWDKGTADYINCPMTARSTTSFSMRSLAAEAAEAKEWEKAEYFEGCLPIEILARRGAGHAALRPHEACRPARSAHRQDSVGGGAVAQGKSARRQLQPGRLSESPEVWRTGQGAAPDSGPRKREVPALRPDSSQHVYLLAAAAGRHAAHERASAIFFAGQISGVEGYTESIASGPAGRLYAAAVRMARSRLRLRGRRRSARW
jgi:methylenetetrahydrofolate--tRNA-(uracil-5-)-methyltransferase